MTAETAMTRSRMQNSLLAVHLAEGDLCIYALSATCSNTTVTL